jgi:hypothetical protein
MKPMMFLGLILIVLGVVILILQFITITSHVKGVNIGPFKTSSTEAKTKFPVPPLLGGLALAGGIVLVILGRKRKP